MKKILSLALALTLCLGLTVPALAVGKSGDTTFADGKGNIVTLSKPILYTISRADVQGIDRSAMKMYIEGEPYDAEYFGPASQYLDEYWSLMGTVYAVPENTVVTLSQGTLTETTFEMDVTWKNNTSHATDFSVVNFPGFSSVTLDGYGYIFSIDLNSDTEIIESDDENSNGQGGTDGSTPRVSDNMISFYVLKSGETANPFALSTSTAPTTTPSETAFSDIVANAYYSDAVTWAVEKNITSGTTATTFSPNSTCTTAQILTFLWRSQGQPEPTIKNPFSDVKSSDYFYKAALWAHEKGLVSGTALNGGTACTRSATVTYLWKLAGSPSAPSAAFSDVPSTADYAQAVAWGVSKNITSGTTASTFSPNATCTRGQIVTFLYRAYK